MRTYGEAILDGNKWTINCEPHVSMRLKRMFKQARGDQPGQVTMTATEEACRDLLWFIDRYPLEVREMGVLQERADAFDKRRQFLGDLIMGAIDPKSFDLAIPARDYQKVAASALLANGGLLLADDLGTGKTCSAICALTEANARPALVVTLTHLPTQWEGEIKKFAPDLTTHIIKKTTPYDVRKKSGRKSKDQEELFEPEFPDVLIMNYHKLAGWAEVLAGNMKTVVFDECQELRRGNQSQKGKAARMIADHAEYRLGMSATPIYNYGEEFWNILQCIQPEMLGTFHEFTNEWCTYAFGDKYKITEPTAFGAYMRDAGVMLRRTRAEVGRELPSLTKVVHTCDVDAGKLEEAEDAAYELARIIMSKESGWSERGQASRELDWRLRQATGIAKAAYVAEFVRLLADSGERVVLYGWHRAVYDLWKTKFHKAGISFSAYTGEESTNQKNAAKEAFVKGHSQVLMMSLRAGAGLDGLQGSCRTVVFGELDWSPGVHEQAMGRVHRDGQKDPVCAYYLVSEDGSDPIISATLGLKRDQLESTLAMDSTVDPALVQRATQGIKMLAERYYQKKAS